MNSYAFIQLKPETVADYLPAMYDILHTNMSIIAPTGNTYEEDKALWTGCVSPALEQERRKAILIFDEDKLAGFFMYNVRDSVFVMEEIQFRPEYRGNGLFTELYVYIVKTVSPAALFTEAYANKKNLKSQAILKHLGLEIVGENKTGSSYRFRGEYGKLLERYS